MDRVMDKDAQRMKLFKKYGYDIKQAREYIISRAGFNKGSALLEIGTGRGHMAQALAGKGFKLVSIDVDRQAQRAAKENLASSGLLRRASLRIMDAERLRFRNGSFNTVVSVNFMHHARRPDKCLREMVRVTKERIVIADINKRGQRIMQKVHNLDGHDHEESRISFPEMKAILQKTGFKVTVLRDRCQTVIIADKEVSK